MAVAAAACKSGEGLAPVDSSVPDSLVAVPLGLRLVRVSWKPVTNATGYRIERRKQLTGAFTEVQSLAGGAGTSWVDTSVVAETVYGYRMRAISPTGQPSAYTVIAGAQTPPVPGIELTTSFGSSANFTDPDGYSVLITSPGRDTIRTQMLPLETRRFSPLPNGTYTLAFGGLAPNCSSQNPLTRTLTVTDQGVNTLTRASLAVDCQDPSRGKLTVATVVTGSSLPTTPFTVKVSGVITDTAGVPAAERAYLQTRSVTPNNSADFLALRPATYTVQISGIPANCTLTGAASVAVPVAKLAAVTQTFPIACGTVQQPPDPNKPNVIIAQWSADSAAKGSVVSLDAIIDLTARAGQYVNLVQADLTLNPAIVRVDSAKGLGIFAPGFSTSPANFNAGSGTGTWLTQTGSDSATGRFTVARFWVTVIGNAGQSFTTGTSLVPPGYIGTATKEITSLFNKTEGAFRVCTACGSAGGGGTGGGGGGTGGGGTGGPTTGTVAGTISRTGSTTSSLSTVVVTVSPSGAAAQSVALGTGTTYSFSGIAPGSGAVALGNLPSGCTATPAPGSYSGLVAGGSATVNFTVNCPAPPPPTLPFTWTNSFGPVGADSTVFLTISLDLTTDIPETAGAEALRSWILQSVKFDPAVLQVTSIAYGANTAPLSGGPSNTNNLNGAGSINATGTLTMSGQIGDFQGPLVNTSGVIAIARIGFKAKSLTAATTTQTTLGALNAPTSLASYDYRTKTSVVEATYGAGGGGGGGAQTGTVSGTVTRTGSTTASLAGVTVTVAPSSGATLSTTLASGTSYSVAAVPTGSGTVALGGLPTGCAAQPASVPYSGLAAGGTATANFTVDCTVQPLLYNYATTWSYTAGATTASVTFTFDPTTGPTAVSGEAANISSFGAAVTYPTARLAYQSCSNVPGSPFAGGNGNEITPGNLSVLNFKNGAGATTASQLLRCTFTVKAGSPATIQLTSDIATGANGVFTFNGTNIGLPSFTQKSEGTLTLP
jgi:hypothetical protein